MNKHRGYYIKNHPTLPGSYLIVTEGRGGKIPDVMRGLFTSVGISRSVIDSYLEKRDATKEKANASKARTKSGD